MAIESHELTGTNRKEATSDVPLELLVLVADGVQLVFVGLVLDWLLFGGVEVWGLVRLGVIAAVLVGMLKSHGWLVLLALQVSLICREPGRSEMTMGIVPWMFSLTAICIVAYAYLGRPFRSAISKWIVLQVLFASGLDNQTPSTSSETQATSSNWLRFITTQFIIWMAVIVVAMLALLRLPISVTVRSEWLRSAIENDFIVWPGATLLVFTLLLIIVFMEAGWRQMTGAQARLYLRSSFVFDHYRDLRMIVLRQMKARRKKANASVPQKQLVERT